MCIDDYAFMDDHYTNIQMRKGYKSHLIDYYAYLEGLNH